MSDKVMTTQNPQGMDVKRKDIPVMVHNQLDKLVAEGNLSFPAGYNASNAIQSAWMIIQDTKDRDNRPALDVCTMGSVMKAMLDTVIMGLNPAKKQVYYIVYGNKLEAQRSYFVQPLKRGIFADDLRSPGLGGLGLENLVKAGVTERCEGLRALKIRMEILPLKQSIIGAFRLPFSPEARHSGGLAGLEALELAAAHIEDIGFPGIVVLICQDEPAHASSSSSR